MVAWLRGYPAGRRHFGFAKVTLCAWVDGKTTEKSRQYYVKKAYRIERFYVRDVPDSSHIVSRLNVAKERDLDPVYMEWGTPV